MIKPDQRTRLQRIQRLRLAAAVLEVLREERPDILREKPLAVSIADQLLDIAASLEASPLPPPPGRLRIVCRECREGTCKIHTPKVLRAKDLMGEPRKPPQRVAMSRRRKYPGLSVEQTETMPRKGYMQMSKDELVAVGRAALAKEGKSPNHRKLKLGSKMREIPLSDLDTRPGEPGRAECGHPIGSAFCTICSNG